MPMAKSWFPFTLAVALAAALVLPAAALADPTIAAVSPNACPMQAYVAIYGSGFGDAQGTGYVTLGGRWLPVISWTDSVIRVAINPAGSKLSPMPLNTPYPVQVLTGAGSSRSNTVEFTPTSGPAPVSTPFLDPIEPASQPALECLNGALFCAGDVATIYGTGFGDTQGTSFVTVDALFVDAHGNTFTQTFTLPVINWGDHAIEVLLSIPANAQPGTYTLTVHRSNGTMVTGSITAGTLVNGHCVPGLPKISLSTTFISFGDCKIGNTTYPHCFTIRNTGTGPLNISSIGLVNCSDSVDPVYVDCSSVAGFTIVSGGGPGTLAPGQSRDVCVTFSPRKIATFDGFVAITSNASPSPVFVQFHGSGDN